MLLEQAAGKGSELRQPLARACAVQCCAQATGTPRTPQPWPRHRPTLRSLWMIQFWCMKDRPFSSCHSTLLTV
jgi:hypothetical protein